MEIGSYRPDEAVNEDHAHEVVSVTATENMSLGINLLVFFIKDFDDVDATLD